MREGDERSPPSPAGGEAEALAALGRGDVPAALSALMDLYGRSIHRYSCHVLGDPDLAQDVLQTTFLQAYQDLPRFAGRSSLRVWLYGIARHRCYDAIKSARRRRWRFLPLPDEDTSSAADPRTHAAIEEDESSRALARCIQELQPRVRAAVMLRFQDEFSYRDMASVCGEQPATLQARVARALPVLKRCLERQGVRP